MEERLLYGLLAIVGAYLVIRAITLFKKGKHASTSVDQELHNVLHQDEHKVKGRFDP